MKTVIISNSSLLTILRSQSAIILIALTLVAFVPAQKTQALNPPPDGGYPGDNTADGAFALVNNVTGNFNAADGTNALVHNTTGSNNIAVGFSAGDNLTTGDNNIDIGAEGVADESNTIRIGAAQRGTFIAGIR